MRFRGSFVAAVLALCALGAAHSRAAVSCRHSYPESNHIYTRLVLVYQHRSLTCAQAAAIGSRVAARYERGLPTADYPPPPNGVPGGKGRRFAVRTAAGEFTCRMTSRGSDFVAARCRHGAAYVRFLALDNYGVARPPHPSVAPRTDWWHSAVETRW